MPESAINQRNATGFLAILIPAALGLSALYQAWPYILAIVLLTIGSRLWSDYQWSQTALLIHPDFQRLIVENRGEITPIDLSIAASISGRDAQRYLAERASEFATGSRQHPERGQIYYFVSVSTLGSIFDDSEREVLELPPSETPLVVIPNFPVPVAAELVVPIVSEAFIAADPLPVILPPIVESVIASPPAVMDIPIAPAPNPTNLRELLDEPVSIQPEPSVPARPPTDQPLVTIIQSELAKRLDVHSSTVYKRRSEPNFTDWTRNRDPEGLGWGYAEDTKEYYRVG